MEETPLEATSQFTPAPKKKINKRFIYLISAIIILVLLFGAYKLLGSNKNTNITDTSSSVSTPTPTDFVIPSDTPTPQTSPTTAETSTPTPKPTGNPVDSATGLDRSKLSVTVENGSGEAGVAVAGKDFLTGLGYGVSGTSNADNFDYVNVTIKIKSASASYLTLLKKDLNTKYTVGDTSSDLDDSTSTDAVVIIGK